MALAVLGGMAAVALVVVTVIAVFYRYILGDPIFGIDDVSTMLLSATVAGAILYGAKIGAHVQVDILNLVGGRKFTRYTDVIIRVLSAGISFLLAFSLWQEVQCGYDCGYFTPNLEISHEPFYWFLIVAVSGFALLQVLELIEGLIHFKSSRDPRELR